MLGRIDNDLAMGLEVVKVMQTIHLDYIDEVDIKYFLQTHDIIKIFDSLNGSS